MTSPAPGWYPDPGGAAPFRWWNGQAWTTATSDGSATPTAQPQTPAQPETPAQPAAQAVPGAMGAATPAFGTPTESIPSAGGPTTAYGTRSPFDSSGSRISGAAPSNYSQVKASQEAQGTSLWHQNQAAFGTFILTAIVVMLVLAFTSPILVFTPIAAASAANQSRIRGEPLAPLAMGAAGVTIVLAIVSLSKIL